MERKKLTDVLFSGSERDRIERAWDESQAAGDFAPIPAAEVIATIVSGELFLSRSKGTPGYKVTYEVLEGEYAGRRFWHDLWLTEAAMPMTKRDLLKLGIESLARLDTPLPARRIRCK